MELTGSDIARLVDCHPSYILRECKKGRLVKNTSNKYESTEANNKRFLIRKNITQANIKKYLKDRIVKSKKIVEIQSTMTAKNMKTPDKSRKKKLINKEKEVMSVKIPKKGKLEDISGLPTDLLKMTVAELVTRYGAPMKLKAYVEILDRIMSASKKEVEIQEKRKELIKREYVTLNLFTHLDNMTNQLFDYPDSVIEIEIAEIKSDEKKSRLKIPEMHRKNFAKIIKEAKKNINRALKRLKVQDDI